MRLKILLRFLRAVFKDSGTPLCVRSASKRKTGDLFKNENNCPNDCSPPLLRSNARRQGPKTLTVWRDMKRRRRTETTIETYEVLKIRTSHGPTQVGVQSVATLPGWWSPRQRRGCCISTPIIYEQSEAADCTMRKTRRVVIDLP